MVEGVNIDRTGWAAWCSEGISAAVQQVHGTYMAHAWHMHGRCRNGTISTEKEVREHDRAQHRPGIAASSKGKQDCEVQGDVCKCGLVRWTCSDV